MDFMLQRQQVASLVAIVKARDPAFWSQVSQGEVERMRSMLYGYWLSKVEIWLVCAIPVGLVGAVFAALTWNVALQNLMWLVLAAVTPMGALAALHLSFGVEGLQSARQSLDEVTQAANEPYNAGLAAELALLLASPAVASYAHSLSANGRRAVLVDLHIMRWLERQRRQHQEIRRSLERWPRGIEQGESRA